MNQQVYFDERFLDQYTGRKLLHDPITALVELVANSWDAGATRVDISWPDSQGSYITIKDNGIGMTKTEVGKRWRTLSYNRVEEQGETVQITQRTDLPLRKTFGRNGIGRFAGFCFNSEYEIITSKDNDLVGFLVKRGNTSSPIILKKINVTEENLGSSGTIIKVLNNVVFTLPAEKIRSEIGMRFLIDPNFEVFINQFKVAFTDLPQDGVSEYLVDVPQYDGNVKIIMIDAKKADRTTKQHGIAWQVNNRLVGECGWHGSGHEAFLDGRRIEAKRYTFIVFADILNDLDIIKPDWSGFQDDNEKFKTVFQLVQDKIREVLLGLTEDRRSQITEHIREANAGNLSIMSPLSRVRWDTFVQTVQEQCPSVAEKDLEAVAGVLAKLETSHSRYALVHKLHGLNPNQLDSLHQILVDWNVDAAKIVLDELQWRLKLINELQEKVTSTLTLEVQELQPLFEKGLWIFGPEFETIEFTSNQGMTTVIQDLFKTKIDASRLRPDFVVLPDGSCGLYSYPEYDEDFAEVGVAKLVFIELKKPGISIGEEQKGQCWSYVKELYGKGFLTDRAEVRCFVLGSKIDPAEVYERVEKDGKVKIQPMLFNTILDRAKSRVLKLYDKVKSAPFLKGKVLDGLLIEEKNQDLFSEASLVKQ